VTSSFSTFPPAPQVRKLLAGYGVRNPAFCETATGGGTLWVYNSNMELDPIFEDVRRFLIEAFGDVRNETPQDNYYAFSFKTSSGQLRRLKVHRSFSTHPGTVSDYLRGLNFEAGDAEVMRLT